MLITLFNKSALIVPFRSNTKSLYVSLVLTFAESDLNIDTSVFTVVSKLSHKFALTLKLLSDIAKSAVNVLNSIVSSFGV